MAKRKTTRKAPISERQAEPGVNRMIESGDANRVRNEPRTRPGGSRTIQEIEAMFSTAAKAGASSEAAPARNSDEEDLIDE